MNYAFEAFEVDGDIYELRHRGRPIALEPQAFDVLAYLVAHRDRVVPKEELLDEVWGTRYVTESALTTRIKEVRRALGDDGRSQRLIRTITGRGYHFVPDVVTTAHTASDASGGGTDGSGHTSRSKFVGRDAELAVLNRLFREAEAGQRRVALVGGGAGEGKTTLLQTLRAEIRRTPAWITVGQSVDHGDGGGEPYLPLLDALGRLCREPGGREVVHVLRHRAPTWLLQLPGTVDGEDADALRASTLGATAERMLREIIEALEELCMRRPMLLVLEDLHWSDRPTLAVVSALARRTTPARLLLAVTYRSGGPTGTAAAVVAELGALRPTCHRMTLDGIDEQAIDALVRDRTGARAVAPELVSLVIERAGRNPLFVITLVEHWMEAGLLAVRGGEIVAVRGVDALATVVPGDLRLLIEHRASALSPKDHEILAAASVVGTTVPAAAVAAAVEGDEEAVERQMHDMARRFDLFSGHETADWPDGTITSVFRFRHSLYQEVLYDDVAAPRRARLHGRVGERLAAAFGDDRARPAADLARHFVLSGDAARAVPALLESAAVALRRSAHAEAVELLTRAQALVNRVPDGDERIRLEANVHATLAPALVAIHGWAAPQVGDAYQRALDLCRLLPDRTPLDAVLYGLATLHEYRAEYDRSQQLTEQRLQGQPAELASSTQVEAHELLACSSFHQGGFTQALRHAETAVAAYDPDEHLALMALHGENPGVSSRHWAAHALWFLGYPDQALHMMQQALALAGDLAHSFSLSHAHEHAAYLHQYRMEPEQVLAHAEATVRLATERGYAYRQATGTMLHGWAAAAEDVPGGLAELTAGLDAYRETGAAMDLPYFLALFADVLTRAGRLDEASRALDEARTIPRGRAYYYEPELLRLRAELLHRRGHSDLARQAGHRAIEVARSLQSRSLELRATLAALRLADDGPGRATALNAVRRAHEAFTEGFDTPDVERARAVLDASVHDSARS